MDIQVLIRKLVSYGVQTGLVPEEDVIYTTNRFLELFELDELEERDNVTCLLYTSYDLHREIYALTNGVDTEFFHKTEQAGGRFRIFFHLPRMCTEAEEFTTHIR